MAQKPTRDLVKIIFQNFINSIKPRQFRGNYIGEDYFGNKYYEIPADSSVGRRKASRWFEPSVKDAFDQELTAEWEAWLRFRRKEPPTKEELVRNLQIMEMKKRNAAELDKIYEKPKDQEAHQEERSGYSSFPRYKDYEIIPGQDPEKRGQT